MKPTPPPSDAYLDAWVARWRKKDVPSVTWNCSELPADLAWFLKESE